MNCSFVFRDTFDCGLCEEHDALLRCGQAWAGRSN
jgi:hypothetical protein